MAGADFVAILRALSRNGVDFVMVGGIAAALRAAPVATMDLGAVYSTEPDNVARLDRALDELNAVYRAGPEYRRRPDGAHLTSPGARLLLTDFGPLDILADIGKGCAYEDLLPHCERVAIDTDFAVLVPDLETLTAVKEEVAGDREKRRK